MATLIAGAVAVFVLYTLLQMLRTANPAVMARVAKLAGGVVCLAIAAFTGVRGQLEVGIPIGIFGAGLLGWAPFGIKGIGGLGGLFGGRGMPGRMNTQFLDMSLDPASGRMTGTIVAGPHAGQSLEAFDLSQLMA